MKNLLCHFIILLFLLINISCTQNEIINPSNTEPTSPKNLQAHIDSTQGNLKINLNWDVPTSNGGSAIIQYIVYKGTAPNNLVILNYIDANLLSFTDTNIVYGNKYYYTVSAKNEQGESNTSNVISMNVNNFIYPPSAPGNFLCVSDDNFAYISWDPPINNGGSPLVNFKIYRGSSQNNLQTLVILDPLTFSFVDTTVVLLNTYFYKITASNNSYEGEESQLKSVEITGASLNSIKGIVTFVDTNFVLTGGNYLISAYPSTGWPPMAGPTAFDTIKVIRTNNILNTNYNYKLININPGAYIVSVTYRKITGGQSPILSVYGCDTVRFQYSSCFLNPPLSANIGSNNQGVGGINMISWADTAKKVY